MKYINTIATIAAALVCFCSCEMKVEKTQLAAADDLVAPVLRPVSDVIVNSDNGKAESVVFSWTSADFGAPVQIKYSLYLANGDKEALAGISFGNSLSVTKTDINGLATNDLGIVPNETGALSAHLVASVNGVEGDEVASNTIAFNISTYSAPLRSLYLPGNYEDGWNIDKAPEFWETDGGTSIYKILVDLADGSDDYSYFKVTTARDWNHDNWGYENLTPKWECPEQKDKNLSIPVAEGTINYLTVNAGKMTIDRTVVKEVDIIGSFDESANWSTDVQLAYDWEENVWASPEVTFSSGTEFLVRLNASWDGDCKYGDGFVASNAVEGGFELTQGGSASNINVPEAGTYVIKLHANRTPWVIVMEKK